MRGARVVVGELLVHVDGAHVPQVQLERARGRVCQEKTKRFDCVAIHERLLVLHKAPARQQKLAERDLVCVCWET